MQVRILPGPFTAKAVTRDTCLLSGVDARALARIGGVAVTTCLIDGAGRPRSIVSHEPSPERVAGSHDRRSLASR